MAFLLLSWVAVGAASISVGSLLIGVLGMPSLGRTGDRLILSLWTGLALSGILLLAISLFTPLTPSLGVVLTAALAAAAAGFPPSRRELSRFGHLRLYRTLLPLFICAGTAALLTSGVISSRDSIAYHYDLVYLLSRIGTVPGLALLHNRYGFLSSWFTIPALFNHGAITGRAATLANGFAIMLSLLHCWLALRRLFEGSAGRGDRFLILALPAAMFMPVLLNYTLSASPDFIIIALTVVMVWLMIVLDEGGVKARGSKVRLLLPESLAPMVLAAAAFTMKFAAAPALPVAFLFHLAKGTFRPAAALSGGLAALILLAPTMASRTVVTGCPLYPAPFCLDLSWSAGEEGAEKAMEPIARVKRVREPANYLTLRWIGQWLRKDRMNWIGAVLFALTLTALIPLLLRGAGLFRRGWFVWLLSAVGFIFLFATSPQTRFAWAYLVIVPAYTLAVWAGPAVSAAIGNLPRRVAPAGALIFLAGLAGVFLSASHFFQTRSEKQMFRSAREGKIVLDISGGVLVPPEIPRIAFGRKSFPLPRKIYYLEGGPSMERGLSYDPLPRGEFLYRDAARGAAEGFRAAAQ